jgi:hypothetical protein
MSFLAAFVAAPWLAATGIYNPQVIDRHHRCLAEPGSFDAIYCSGAEATPPVQIKKRRSASR